MFSFSRFSQNVSIAITFLFAFLFVNIARIINKYKKIKHHNLLFTTSKFCHVTDLLVVNGHRRRLQHHICFSPNFFERRCFYSSDIDSLCFETWLIICFSAPVTVIFLVSCCFAVSQCWVCPRLLNRTPLYVTTTSCFERLVACVTIKADLNGKQRAIVSLLSTKLHDSDTHCLRHFILQSLESCGGDLDLILLWLRTQEFLHLKSHSQACAKKINKVHVDIICVEPGRTRWKSCF